MENFNRFILIMLGYYFICTSELINTDCYYRPNSSESTKYKKEAKQSVNTLIKGSFKLNYGKHSRKQMLKNPTIKNK